MDVLGFSAGQFFAAMLLMVRVGSLFIYVPIFSHPYLPVKVKAAVTMVITVSLAYAGIAGTVIPPQGLMEMILMVAREAAIGLMIGLTMQILFLAVLFGGQVVGVQMGMNMASMMDPQFKVSVSEVASIYYYGALLLFLAVGGDRMILEALVGNIHSLPLGRAHVPPSAVKALVYWTGEIFNTGFMLVAPVLSSLFCTSILLGILARSVPQMNMLMLGYSLKIAIGLIIMALAMPAWVEAFLRFTGLTFEIVYGMKKLMVP